MLSYEAVSSFFLFYFLAYWSYVPVIYFSLRCLTSIYIFTPRILVLLLTLTTFGHIVSGGTCQNTSIILYMICPTNFNVVIAQWEQVTAMWTEILIYFCSIFNGLGWSQCIPWEEISQKNLEEIYLISSVRV